MLKSGHDKEWYVKERFRVQIISRRICMAAFRMHQFHRKPLCTFWIFIKVSKVCEIFSFQIYMLPKWVYRVLRNVKRKFKFFMKPERNNLFLTSMYKLNDILISQHSSSFFSHNFKLCNKSFFMQNNISQL